MEQGGSNGFPHVDSDTSLHIAAFIFLEETGRQVVDLFGLCAYFRGSEMFRPRTTPVVPHHISWSLTPHDPSPTTTPTALFEKSRPTSGPPTQDLLPVHTSSSSVHPLQSYSLPSHLGKILSPSLGECDRTRVVYLRKVRTRLHGYTGPRC